MKTDAFTAIRDDQKTDRFPKFMLDLKGFEGPLHLLLNLSRAQKVDLRQISLVELCDQYLDFISAAKKLEIEIAADYLIMAAWLIFLKSELLLPKEVSDLADDHEDLAQNLRFQLLRLDAMRHAAVKLMSSDQLDRDFFARGEKDIHADSKAVVHTASLLDMLQSYARLKTKEDFEPLHLKRSFVLTPEEALKIINKKLKLSIDWLQLEQFIPKFWRHDTKRKRTAMATNFAVFLELARLNKVEIMQAETFAPLYLRKLEDY